MSFLKGIKDELSHAVNEYVNNESDTPEDDTYSASKEAEEEFRRKRNEEAASAEEEPHVVYNDMFNKSDTTNGGQDDDYMVNTIDGDKRMGNSGGATDERENRVKSGTDTDSKVSLKDIAGDIQDKLNDEKLDEMLNEDKEQKKALLRGGQYGIEEERESESSDEHTALASDEVTEITKGTIIDGNIVTDGSANIYGKVKGNLACKGRLFVSGTILGSSRAADITMNGAKIDGDVTSDGNLKIGNGSIIRGNIYGTSAVIAGAIRGDIDIKGPVVIDGTAVIQGNICSRSIQINNGAAIEGMISQSYAEIDYAALFDKSFEE